MHVEELVEGRDDVRGYVDKEDASGIQEPNPVARSAKIAVLRLSHKSSRAARVCGGASGSGS
jgi:hypothetical protein